MSASALSFRWFDGSVTIGVSGERAVCAAGTLVAFERGERHSLDALEDCVLLLILAPWPAREHYAAMEAAQPQQLPANSSVDPIVSTSASD